MTDLFKFCPGYDINFDKLSLLFVRSSDINEYYCGVLV